jgi:hypothetical protein
MDQLTLFADMPATPVIEPRGKTYNPKQDRERLLTQQDRVETIMGDGMPRSLDQLESQVNRRFKTRDTQAAISARLRDMRRRSWIVNRERVAKGSGLFLYRASKPETAQAA